MCVCVSLYFSPALLSHISSVACNPQWNECVLNVTMHTPTHTTRTVCGASVTLTSPLAPFLPARETRTALSLSHDLFCVCVSSLIQLVCVFHKDTHCSAADEIYVCSLYISLDVPPSLSFRAAVICPLSSRMKTLHLEVRLVNQLLTNSIESHLSITHSKERR